MPKEKYNSNYYPFIFILTFFLLPHFIGFLPKPINLLLYRIDGDIAQGTLTEHYCPDDNVYIYSFYYGHKVRQGEYFGYLNSVEKQIKEGGCKGELDNPVSMNIRVVSNIPKINRPEEVGRPTWVNIILSFGLMIGISHFAGRNYY